MYAVFLSLSYFFSVLSLFGASICVVWIGRDADKLMVFVLVCFRVFSVFGEVQECVFVMGFNGRNVKGDLVLR